MHGRSGLCAFSKLDSGSMMDREKKMLETIGRRIRDYRYENSLEQVDLAELLEGKISRSCISYFENGKRTPSLNSLFLLSEALNVEPLVFFLDPKRDQRHRLIAQVMSIPGDSLGQLESEMDAILVQKERRKTKQLSPKK